MVISQETVGYRDMMTAINTKRRKIRNKVFSVIHHIISYNLTYEIDLFTHNELFSDIS
jgi:hypothetical protein